MRLPSEEDQKIMVDLSYFIAELYDKVGETRTDDILKYAMKWAKESLKTNYADIRNNK